METKEQTTHANAPDNVVQFRRDTPYFSLGINTPTMRRAICQITDVPTIADLLFLEAWEMGRMDSVAATMRAAQIRRANPALAAQVRQEAQQIRSYSSRHAAALSAASVRFFPGGSYTPSCQIASNHDPYFASKNDPLNV